MMRNFIHIQETWQPAQKRFLAMTSSSAQWLFNETFLLFVFICFHFIVCIIYYFRSTYGSIMEHVMADYGIKRHIMLNPSRFYD